MTRNARNMPFTILACLAVALGAFAAFRATSTESSQRAQPTAVAVVDWLEMTDKLDEWKEKKMQLADEEAVAKDELQKMQDTIKNKQDELQIVKGTPEYAEREQEVRDLVAQFQIKLRGAEDKLTRRRTEEQLKLYQKIDAAVTTIAERDGWDLVVWKDDVSKAVDLNRPLDEAAQLISQRHVFYAVDSVNITPAVVQFMNNEFHSGQKN